MFDVIIVGSGAAGTFSAYSLRGLKTLVLDVGHTPPAESLPEDLCNLEDKEKHFNKIIGCRFESLNDIEFRKVTPKVKAPLMRYVIQEPEWTSPIHSEEFFPTISYAEGGLANIWGAQVYRFGDEDLKGFPISAEELRPFYDELTEHIGISGTEDDLGPFLGEASGMLPPLKPSKIGAELLKRYQRKSYLFRSQGVYLGQPRLAVLSTDHRAREKCSFDNLEFFQSRNSAIYSPAFTLQEMVAKKEIEYLSGRLVERYEESEDRVTVLTRNINDGSVEKFQCKILILCLGALNTARMVLFSHNDFLTKLPVVENPFTLTPLISLTRIGMALDREAYSSQLCFVYSGKLSDELIVGMIYGIEGLLRSDLLFDFPLAVSGCIAAAKYILPAMAVMQVYRPSDPQTSNYLKINQDGTPVIRYLPVEERSIEQHLLRVFRRIGYLSAPFLIRQSEPGLSNHYAGPLPMRAKPQQPYETDRNGLLYGSKKVYVGDSASFPRLPAKNLTFTIMANAMRIARNIKSVFQESL